MIEYLTETTEYLLENYSESFSSKQAQYLKSFSGDTFFLVKLENLIVVDIKEVTEKLLEKMLE